MLYKLDAILMSVFILPHMHYDLKKKSGLGRNERKALSWDPVYYSTEFSRFVLPSVPIAGISIHHLDLTLPAGDSSRYNLVVPKWTDCRASQYQYAEVKFLLFAFMSFILWLL